MASNSAPVVDRIRIIPRPDDFLDRNVGSSGEVFYDKQANTLRVYSGKQPGGFTLLTSGNLSQQLADAGVALLERVVTVGVDTVSGQASGVFYIDGVEKPAINLVRGYTYLFEQSDATNTSYAQLYHPLMFSTVENGELADGGHYNSGVVYLLDDDPVTMAEYVSGFQAATTRKILLTPKTNTPDQLYYWCHFHLNQGNSISIADPGTGSGAGGGASVDVSDTAPDSPDAGNIWFNSANGSLFVYITDEDSSQWVQPTSPIPAFTTFSSVQITSDAVSSIDAATKSDILRFAPGTNVTLGIDEATNTITINSTGGGGSSYDQSLNTTDTVSFAALSTPSFTNSGVGAAVFDSSSTIELRAPDGISLENIFKQTEVLSSLTGATGVVEHDLSNNAIFDHTSISANFTANFTNVPATADRAINAVLVLHQGATPYVPNAVQIDGAAQTINWLESLAPSGTASGLDVITFTLLRVGTTWTVLGGYANYG
jgi:hypothetical protein